MYPELFHIGGFTLNSFGVMMALAFISAGFVGHWQFKKRGVKPDFVYGLLIAAVIGGLLGAKIHYLILHPSEWPGNLLSGGGLVWFGGLFGAIVAVVIVTLLSKQRLAAVMDSGAMAVAVGYAVGRIGCFLPGHLCPSRLGNRPSVQAGRSPHVRLPDPSRRGTVLSGVHPHQSPRRPRSHPAAVDQHRDLFHRDRGRVVVRGSRPASPACDHKRPAAGCDCPGGGRRQEGWLEL
jgi:prolipoprotein diacylglyceryltransferase